MTQQHEGMGLTSHGRVPGFDQQPQSGIKVEALERDVVPIRIKDFGLVLVAKGIDVNRLKRGDYEQADIIIGDDGIPRVSPAQLMAERQRITYAHVSGRPDKIKVYPFFVEAAEKTVDVYGLPSNILRWSMGIGYSDENPTPVFPFMYDQLTLNPSFDEAKKIYTPDMEELDRLGYSEEGKRRLANLALMTRFASYANGMQKVEVNYENCKIAVLLDSDDRSFQSNDGSKPIGFIFSLSGVNVIIHNGPFASIEDITELRSIDRSPEGYSRAVQHIVDVCKNTITRELNRRVAVTQAAQAAWKVFDSAKPE